MTQHGYNQDPRFQTAPDGSTIDLLAQDKKFSELSPKLPQVTTGNVDLSSFCVAMNQYNLSSCVGNGACESLEILENIAHQGIPGYEPTLLSRMFVWAMASTQEGTLGQDTGCNVRTAFNTLATLGVCTEVLWPYQNGLTTLSPSILAQRQALGHTIQGAYRIDSLGDQRLQDIVTALQANHPICFGTLVTDAFERLSDAGPVSQPNAVLPSGGHCLVVVGWDGTNFLVKNSWGTGWGDAGFCLLTPDYMTWDETTDLWVPTLGPAFSLRRP